MILFFVVLGLLLVLGLVGTIRAVLTDGYGRVPDRIESGHRDPEGR